MKRSFCVLSLFSVMLSLLLILTTCGGGGKKQVAPGGIILPNDVIGTFALGSQSGTISLTFLGIKELSITNDDNHFSLKDRITSKATDSGDIKGTLTIGSVMYELSGKWWRDPQNVISISATVDTLNWTISGTFTDAGGFTLIIADGINYGAIAVIENVGGETSYTVYIGYYDLWFDSTGNSYEFNNTIELWWKQVTDSLDPLFYLQDQGNIDNFNYLPLEKTTVSSPPVMVTPSEPGMFVRLGGFNLTIAKGSKNFVGTYSHLNYIVDYIGGGSGTFEGHVDGEKYIVITKIDGIDLDNPALGKGYNTNTIEGIWYSDNSIYGQWLCNAIDTSNPCIKSWYPSSGQENVPVNSTISITFSKSMKHSDTENAFKLQPVGGDQSVVGISTWGSGDTILNFTPSSALSNNTRYRVSVSTGAVDQDEKYLTEPFTSWFHTVNAPDTTPPEVVLVDPPNGAPKVAINSEIEVDFSEPMDLDSVKSAFSLKDEDSKVVGGEFSWFGYSTMKYKPNELENNKTYNITVGTGAKDASGNSMSVDFNSYFTTVNKSVTGRITVPAPLDTPKLCVIGIDNIYTKNPAYSVMKPLPVQKPSIDYEIADVPNGSYYIWAYIDMNSNAAQGDGQGQGDPGDYFGAFGGLIPEEYRPSTSIQIEDNNNRTNLDIPLQKVTLPYRTKDSPNDVQEFDFINITDAYVKVDDTSIHCELTVRNIPDQLIFDNENLPEMFAEYSWAVYFDINHDGFMDYQMSIDNFKLPGETQKTVSRSQILANTQEQIWKLIKNPDGSISTELMCYVQAELLGDNKTFVLDVEKSASAELYYITDESRIDIGTYYRYDSLSYARDNWP